MCVGRGSFGVVHRAIERATGRNWAAKFVACTTIERAMVRGEIDVRNDLRHPNLLQLHEAFETHGEIAFILELYAERSLIRIINTNICKIVVTLTFMLSIYMDSGGGNIYTAN